MSTYAPNVLPYAPEWGCASQKKKTFALALHFFFLTLLRFMTAVTQLHLHVCHTVAIRSENARLVSRQPFPAFPSLKWGGFFVEGEEVEKKKRKEDTHWRGVG